MHRWVPTTFVSRTAAKSSIGCVTARSLARTPAFATSAPIGPSSCSARVKARSTDSSSVTSSWVMITFAPAAISSPRSAAASCSCVRYVTHTGQPSDASARATAAPMPVAPVTSAEPRSSSGIAGDSSGLAVSARVCTLRASFHLAGFPSDY